MIKSFSVSFGTPCRHAATLGGQKIDNMISACQLKKWNGTILIYQEALFCGRNFRGGVFVASRFVFAIFCWSDLKSRRRKGSRKPRTIRFME